MRTTEVDRMFSPSGAGASVSGAEPTQVIASQATFAFPNGKVHYGEQFLFAEAPVVEQPKPVYSWPPHDPRVTDPITQKTFIPDRNKHQTPETQEERVTRIWARLSNAQVSLAGPNREFYADRLARQSRVLGTRLDTINDIMRGFKQGAEKLGIKLEGGEVPLQPSKITKIGAPDGGVIYRYEKSVQK